MQLVNGNYVKLSQVDAFGELSKAVDDNNINRTKYFNNLAMIILRYQRKNNTRIYDIYIRIDEKSFASLGFNVMEMPIERESIVNAFFIAAHCFNLEMQTKLRGLVNLPSVLPSKVDAEVLEYILNNSMDINDFINGMVWSCFVYHGDLVEGKDGDEVDLDKAITKEIVFDRTKLDTNRFLTEPSTEDKYLSFTIEQIEE